MDELMELEAQSDRLTATIKDYIKHRRNLESSDRPWANCDTNKEYKKAKTSIQASLGKIQALIDGPIDFLQDLARQVEIVACLKWLAEFQILACIPPDGSMPIKDLADLAGVPEMQLSRVIRLTGTSRFLQEPMKDYVSHTPLSAQFIANQSWLDAAVFMADLAAPTALHMPMATQRFGASRNPTETAYSLARNSTRPFGVAIQGRPKLSRQWSAYLQQALGLHQEREIMDMLSQLKWSNLGSACIVEVGALSTSMAQNLAKKFPTLHLIVQIDHARSSSLNIDFLRPNDMLGAFTRENEAQLESECNSTTSSRRSSASDRITVTYRAAGMPQPVSNAAVYILHLPVISMSSSAGSESMDIIKAELQDYLGILRASGGILLIPTANLLPEPGSLSDPKVEALARARDLNMLQLANEGEIEMTELLSVIDTIRDGLGKLTITNQLRSHNSLILGLTIKYEAYC